MTVGALFATVVSANAQSGLSNYQQQELLKGSTWRVIGYTDITNKNGAKNPIMIEENSLVHFSTDGRNNLFTSLGEMDLGLGFYSFVDVNDDLFGMIVKTDKYPKGLGFGVSVRDKRTMFWTFDSGLTFIFKRVYPKYRIYK